MTSEVVVLLYGTDERHVGGSTSYNIVEMNLHPNGRGEFLTPEIANSARVTARRVAEALSDRPYRLISVKYEKYVDSDGLKHIVTERQDHSNFHKYNIAVSRAFDEYEQEGFKTVRLKAEKGYEDEDAHCKSVR